MSESLTVGELCEAIGFAITTCFPTELWVSGTVAGISRSAAGHVYFDFVDPEDEGPGSAAVLPVALFSRSRKQVNAILNETGAARITDGVELKIKGKVNYYPRQGRVQLIMSSIDPSFTLGRLELARAKLLAELGEAGLLETNGRLTLPALPLSIALITGEASAAEADFTDELASSGYPFTIHRIPSLVQGADAPPRLVQAIERAQSLPVDAIALVRGGGAQTDLAAFDHRDVAFSIAACGLPVITGIGHDTDLSVADQVAHTSLKTPTAVAGFLIQTVASFEQRVESCAARITTASALATATHSSRLDQLEHRLTNGASRTLENHHHRLDTMELRVKASDPAHILEKGWSITIGHDGKAIRSVEGLADGDRLTTRVLGGSISSVITSIEVAMPAKTAPKNS